MNHASTPRGSGQGGPPASGLDPVVRAAAMMIGASALLAMTSLLAKALGRGVEGPALHPLQISAGRFCFALIAITVVAAWMRPTFTRVSWPLHGGRSVCGWLGVTCTFAAAARMPLSDATAISFLSPIVTMVLAVLLLSERVGPVRWSAAAISLIGAVVLIRPGTSAFQPAALIALSAALFMGVELILIKWLTAAERPLQILLVNNSIGAVISVSAAAFVWTAPAPAQWAMLALLGLIMASAQALFIQAVKGVDASYIVPFFYSTLVFAAFYDVLLFGDRPDALGLIGAIIIVAGAVLLAWREARKWRT